MSDIVSNTINTGQRQASNLLGMFLPLVVGTVVIAVVSNLVKK